MQTSEAQVILDRVHDKMMAVSRFPLGGNQFHKMETIQAEYRLPTQQNLRQELLDALRQMPAGLLEEPEEDHYTILLGSGSGKSHPAVLEIWLSDTEMRISAWAKEGLLHAGAAQTAIDQVLRAMGVGKKRKA